MSKRTQLAVAMVMLVWVLALAPGAIAAVDYSKNSATGDYAPADAPAATTSGDSGFAWGDAAVGAAVALALVVTVTALRRGFSAGRVRPIGRI
jgi:hypothetical protein